MFVYELFEEGDDQSLRDSNPCWTGYRPVGIKNKSGKTVPNCVPTNESDSDLETKTEGIKQ